MGEIIGRMACPVCGEPGQNLKINKNGNLYMYCDNRCSTRFNPKESREIIETLRRGESVRRGGLEIRPAGVPVAVKTEEKQQMEVKNDREQRGNTIIRRGGARPADTARDERPRGILASWLWDDDIA